MYIPNSIVTNSADETEKVGQQLAELLDGDASLPRFIAMYGDLGVGKTAFIRGFTSRISPDAKVKSPTFALVHEYPAKPHPVFHFDMYRITDEDELYSIGFYDYLNRDGYILIEWSENIEFALPEKYISVNISKLDLAYPDRRLLEIKLSER